MATIEMKRIYEAPEKTDGLEFNRQTMATWD